MQELDYDGAMAVLVEDVKSAIMQRLGNNEQFARRSYVRTLFALVDAWVFSAKNAVLKAHAGGTVPLNSDELPLLREKAYELDEAGKVLTRDKYPPFLANVKFAFAVYARSFSRPYHLDPSGSGWSDFRAAYKIRNRLTHPKTNAALSISDDELATVERASDWFIHVSAELVRGP
jgi:hypothetical protein